VKRLKQSAVGEHLSYNLQFCTVSIKKHHRRWDRTGLSGKDFRTRFTGF
jgi:hypothetical protein